MNQEERELIDLAKQIISAAAASKADSDKAKADAAAARKAKSQQKAKLQKKYEHEAAKREAGCTISRLIKRVDAANAQVNLQAEAMGRLRSERDELLSLVQELISNDGPQPGTEEWLQRARTVIANANLDKKAA